MTAIFLAAILDSGTEIELTTYRDVFGLQNTTIVNILKIYQKKETVQITRVICVGRHFYLAAILDFGTKNDLALNLNVFSIQRATYVPIFTNFFKVWTIVWYFFINLQHYSSTKKIPFWAILLHIWRH